MTRFLDRRVFHDFDVFTVGVIGVAAIVTFGIAIYAANVHPPRSPGPPQSASAARLFLTQIDIAFVGALRVGQQDLDREQSDVTGETTAAPTLASISTICNLLVEVPARARAASGFDVAVDEPLLAAYEYVCQQAAQPTPLVADQPLSMRHNFADMIHRLESALSLAGSSAPGPYRRLPSYVAP